ncbi:MAG TPA: tetratricopeptide repeat protein [Solirubrobacteraceae bacterium]
MSDVEPSARALAEGAALIEMGRPADAAAAFARAVASDPGNARALTELALAELKLGDPAQARATIERALAIDAESDQAYRVLARTLLAVPGAHDEARAAALKSVGLVPEGFRGYIILSEALLACGDTAGAIQAAQRSIRLAPEDSATHATLALALLRSEQWAAAEASGREAVRLDPENAGALNNLAVAVQRRGRGGEAVAMFEQASRINPRNDTIHKNIRRIGRTRAARGLSPPARALVADERRARRYDPRRWDWSRIRGFRPFWWILLKRVEAPKALAINAVVFGLLLYSALASPEGVSWVWVVLLGSALPFSGIRAWRWWRIRHPSASSWRPTDVDDQTWR